MKRFRPTAIPLITVDPYFNIWSFSDQLYDSPTRHWSGIRNPMSGFLEIDGIWFGFMGSVWADNRKYLRGPVCLKQSRVIVLPTTTLYEFENELVCLTLKFITPLLVDDLALMTRPVSYISYAIKVKDDKKHNIRMYFDIGMECCVHDINDTVALGRNDYSIFCGKGGRDVLKRSGDLVTIEWGWLHIAAPGAQYMALKGEDKRNFLANKDFTVLNEGFVQVSDDYPSIACVREYPNISAVEDFIVVAYNDIYAVEFFGEKLRPYWYEDEGSFDREVKNAIATYDIIKGKCEQFDKQLLDGAIKISRKYADITALVYRQVIAAHKLVQKDGRLLFFSKECASNGCMGTVDVTYPSMPMFLLLNPELVKGMLNPVFAYAENYGWNFLFAPHDVGRYPLANGQVYGFDKKLRIIKENMQMPVEECGNMLLCVGAICKRESSTQYAQEHKEMLGKWADYLVQTGFDPGYQLCTDDFAGRLAHNCNLSVKGILAIAAWGSILDKMGEDGSGYTAAAKKYARKWEQKAEAGGHYRLVFDQADTWSLKYNLVWDRYLKLGIFDKKVFKSEVEFYKSKMNKYGIPLDSRMNYTKSDWQMWTACLTDNADYRKMVIDAMWELICDMPDRVPFTDWYETKTPEQVGFQNRTVQGGLFLPLLFLYNS